MVMLMSSSSVYFGAYCLWKGYKWLTTKRRNQETWSIIPTVEFVKHPWCSPECRHEFDDKYATVSKLGSGAFGVVYKGASLSSNELVAVKIETGHSGQREMEILRSVQDCPNIIRLIEGFQFPTQTIMVMDLAWGSLEDLGVRNKDDELKKTIFSDIVEGVGFIHYRMIAHRDLKPANILIKKGRALLADFGIAERVGTPGRERYVSNCPGTTAYLAPEVARGGSFSALRSDVWAVGCIIYYLLTGTHLYQGLSTSRLANVHASTYVEIPESVPVNPITSGLVESMYNALEYDPDQRPHVYML